MHIITPRSILVLVGNGWTVSWLLNIFGNGVVDIMGKVAENGDWGTMLLFGLGGLLLYRRKKV